jgi:integrase
LFLYNEVLEKDLNPDVIDAVRAKKPKRLPVVMTRDEAMSVLAALSGTNQLVARLLYGSGHP